MTAMQGALSAAERSMRSVFVGNIPYEATEEQLKDIFSEVGPVVSFRLVYDRETGKPKGYGFCEYKDQEMALSAMRNLNGYELNGRALRVDNAASEKSKEELKNLQASLGGPPVESPYGADVPPEDAPEAIAKVMSSLPPEQLYELMLQMKQCLENNPNETRDLLLQNPQLSYALLQAQVIMKIVDTEKAKTMLHSENPFVMSASALLPTPEVNNAQAQKTSTGINDGPPAFAPAIPLVCSSPVTQNTTTISQRSSNHIPGRPSLLGDRPIPANNSGPPNQFPDHGLNSRSHGDEDLRQMPVADRDMRAPPPSALMGGDQDMRHLPVDKDFRSMTGPPRSLDSRFPNVPPTMQNMPRGDIRNMPSSDMRNMPPGDMRSMQNLSSADMRNLPLGDMHTRASNDMLSQPRGMPPMNSLNMPPGGRTMAPGDSRNMPVNSGRNLASIDNRGMPLGDASNRGPMFDRPLPGGNFDGHRPPVPGRVDDRPTAASMNSSNVAVRPLQNPRMNAVGSNSPAIGGASPNPAPSPRSNAAFATAAAIAPHDQEKATLIMQVLQLSDQQIAILPPEQRQSILILKEQIARSTQAS